MSEDIQNFGPRLKVSELDHTRPQDIAVSLSDAQATALARLLGIEDARKVRLTGVLAPVGRRDWRFKGTLGATVVQPCVVTLAPVTSRIDDPVERTWIEGLEPVTAEESEIPEDVTQEPLGPVIDIGTLLSESLALSLPLYPRADDAELGEAVFTEPGKDAMRDEDTRPFASLAALRDKLKDSPDESGSE
ncbi:YceD family protein [uncultured Maritimibacter sp.]|uniref:YceD family protein n=1 Tax=uncultured Maritimibacter sp. TaxID=991866 RepID=UPI0026210614|nr:YceD family protein [uncultured Maritimibacter sp.]